MDSTVEKVTHNYAQAYQKLYNRTPRELRILDHEWVVVNGARMRISELEFLTHQLLNEYNQGLQNRRNLVSRLINWFKG